MSWIYGNRYLSESEMKNNATLVYAFLKVRGWSINAISALLGNMESESTINPAIWESLDYGNTSGGYGLVQWTPARNYLDWATLNGYDIEDGNAQLLWIDEVTGSFGQWIPTQLYPMSFEEFKKSTQTPQYLASAFLKNFERAGVEVEEERRSHALEWFEYLGGGSVSPDNPTPTPTPSKRKRKNFNFILFNRQRRTIL